MKLTRRRTSFVLVCGLSLAALAVDRLFLAPGEAAAEPLVEEPTRLVTAGEQPRAAVDPSPSVRSELARRFSELAEERGLDPSDVRDVFRAPSSWIPAEPVSEMTAPEGSMAARFIAAHRLNAVMANERGGYAIVDGQTVRIGQTLDGFLLVEIEERAAVLEAGGVRIKLTLSESNGDLP